MAEKPRRPKTGGRVKGTPNKVNAELKDMILGALNDEGGQQYLRTQAKENPTAFLSLVGKVLPMTVQGDTNNPLTFTITTGVPRAAEN
ncbi:MAG: hypothetical protein IPG25_15305 [Proteobacteria bacterium]|jgi:hypothetical protein|nr:hypothetical protein [Pseudomonadota bacterium]